MAVTRFAPSPTGPLHLGHAFAAMVAHDCARDAGGQFLLRIDDIDAGRVRPEYTGGIHDALAWLGLVPDAPPLVQSSRAAAYDDALQSLIARGLAYPCYCTRSEIAAEVAASAAAPHGPLGAAPYPRSCAGLDAAARAAHEAAGRRPAWRLDMTAALATLAMPGGAALTWHDVRLGERRADAAQLRGEGDVVLARRDALASYHLASTIDDAHLGITLVTRGADLAAATAIHRLLQALLGLPTPQYLQHALVADGAGRRLAKRDDAAALSTLADAGWTGAALLAAMRSAATAHPRDLCASTAALPLGYRLIDP